MPLRPTSTEQIQGTAQAVLAYLEDPENRTPNNMLEAILSAKSLMRGIIGGHLVVCAYEPDPKDEEPEEAAPEPTG